MYCMYYHPEEGNNNSLTLTLVLDIIIKYYSYNNYYSANLFYPLVDRSGSYPSLSAGVSGVFLVVN